MSVRTFGIYIAFAPGVDLRHEGLGRYLAAFLKGAAERQDRRFILLCPSWSQRDLQLLFTAEGVPEDRFEILAPATVPLMLSLHARYGAWCRRPRRQGPRKWLEAWASEMKMRFCKRMEHRLVNLQSYGALVTLLPEVTLAISMLVLASPLLVLGGGSLLLRRTVKRVRSYVNPVRLAYGRLTAALALPKHDAVVLKLYRQLEQVESDRMLAMLNGRADIEAWYCPTAFWPAFHAISAPRLMCVPDVVLSDFPAGFAQVGSNRFLQTFERVECAIRSGEHFVTYSEAVKRNTLMARYGIEASCVNVIHHAPNDLSHWIGTVGSANTEETSRNFCRTLLLSALRRATNAAYMNGFKNPDIRFLFYASQFRPNKNVIGLLRAYEYLLRRRYIGHKLILTGHPETYPVIKQFIVQHALENDVICLHGLSVRELAACYKLAELVVNPSKSEGGFPFTFSEALSVNTPVVMARIGVTEEVISDPTVRAAMLFDPDDWRHMAERIEWALEHLDELRALQKPLHEHLVRRSWSDVVNQHIEVLERISARSERPETL